MKRFSPVVVYTSSRLVLFIVTATALALAGMQGVLLLLVALVVSGLLSYVLLSKQRDAMSAAVVERTARRSRAARDGAAADDGAPADQPGPAEQADRPVREGRLSRLRSRLDERTRAEDEADEAARREQQDPPGTVR